jgi:porin
MRLISAALLASIPLGGIAAEGPAAPEVPTGDIRVTPVITLEGDWLGSRGGARSGSAFLAKPEARLTLEDEARRAWVLDLGAINGQSISAVAGDVQGTSNIEGPRAARVLDLFYESPVGRSRTTLARAGVIDLNAFFYVQGDAAAIFLNSSHGIGPEFSHSGVTGPSVYPNMGLAAILEQSVGRHTARLGVFDAQPNDPDRPAHMALHWPGRKGSLLVGEWDTGPARLGGWSYTNSFDRLDGRGRSRGNAGAYGILEFQPTKSLAVWATTGISNRAFNAVDTYVGGGLVGTMGRNSAGVAIASAGFAAGGPRETTIELTAPVDLGRGFSVQPDVQYVMHPGGSHGSAWVAGVRLHFSYDGTESPRPILLRRGRLRPPPSAQRP